jgi:hypothetical protein
VVVERDQGAPLEIRLKSWLRPWTLVALLISVSVVIKASAGLLRDDELGVRILGIAILAFTTLGILASSYIVVIELGRTSRIRLDVEGLTLRRWPRIPWSEIHEVRVHEVRGPLITRKLTSVVAFIPIDPEAVYDTIRRATGPLERPLRTGPYQTPLAISSAQLPIPVDHLLEAVRRLSNAPIIAAPAPQVPRRLLWAAVLGIVGFFALAAVVTFFVVSAAS